MPATSAGMTERRVPISHIKTLPEHRMAWIHPAAVEHRRKLYTRQDAWRLAPPCTPEAKMPGWLDPSATRVRLKEAQDEEARLQTEAAQEEFERELLELCWLVKSLRTDLLMLGLRHKYSPDQPRDELGRWTDAGGGVQSTTGSDEDAEASTGESLEQDRTESQDRRSPAQDRNSFLAPGPGQEPRRDLLDLDAIARHPTVRARIDEAWAASDPNGFGKEQGFWISRNDTTGELFTLPFANEGGPARIIPGTAPGDAVAFFHTHPGRPDFGGDPTPSPYDRFFAIRAGLPGLVQSHSGMYYFGPLLRPR
jgi:hypothetical protein